MRRIRNALAMILAVMMLSGPALAQDDPNPPGPRPEGNGEGAGNRRGDGQGGGRMRGQQDPGVQGQRGPGQRGQQRPGQRLQQVLAQLKLTDVQKAKIDAIIAEQNAPMQAAREAMQQARESGDEEAIQAARQAMTELREQRGQGPDKELIRRIAAELTKTQRERFIYLMGPAGPFEDLLTALKGMELEPAQMRQISQIAAQAKAEARMKTDEKEKVKVFADAQKKIMDLLTDEQKAQLRRLMAPPGGGQPGGAAMLEGLNLTPEQEKAIAAIRAETEEGGDPQAARRRIFNEVLTDEQKEQFRQQMQQRFQGGGRGGPNGGGGQGRPGPGRGGPGPNVGNGAVAE